MYGKPNVIVDVESRSVVNLTTEGFHNYVNSDTTVPLTIVALFDDVCRVWVNAEAFGGITRMPRLGMLDVPKVYGDPGEVKIDVVSGVPKWLRDASKTHTFIGHNATGFDDPYCRQILGLKADWFDTYPIARQAGLPGGLDKIGEKLIRVGKHTGAKHLHKFYDALTHTKMPTETLLWTLVSYNICDCLLTRILYQEIQPFIPDAEREVFALHNKINRRGVRVDERLRTILANVSETAKERAGEEIETLTRGPGSRAVLSKDSLRSVPKMKDWLAANGFKVENMRRETITNLLGDPDKFFVGGEDIEGLESVMPIVPRVLRLRTAATRNTKAKLVKMAGRVSAAYERMYDLLIYFGAHTGRFSSRVVQLHNMARGINKYDPNALLRDLARVDVNDVNAQYDLIAAEASRVREQSGAAWVSVDDVIGSLLRNVIVPSDGRVFGIVDYNAIECRGAGYVADEQKLLDAYRAGRDPYCEFGTMLFGRPITAADKGERFISKIVVLGSQYGLSGGKLALFGANNGIDFAGAGLTADQCIGKYREMYWKIPEVWYRYADAVTQAVEQPGSIMEAGKCRFGMWHGHLLCQLPSGRELCYRNAAIEPVTMRWGETKNVPCYDHHHNYRKSFWYGLIIENVVQAMCRDLLCDAMLKLDARGFDVVLHVHDEIVCELEDASQLKEMEAVMSAGAEWSAGFPIGVEGFTSARYGKSKVH